MNPSQAAFAELRKDLDKAQILARIQAQTIDAMGAENQKLKASEVINHAMIGSMTRTMEGLAAQMEVMRAEFDLIKGGAENWKGGWSGTAQACDRALALPNTTADILRQRDARTLREAAEIMLGLDVEVAPEDWLLNRADELAPRTLRTTEVSNG